MENEKKGTGNEEAISCLWSLLVVSRCRRVAGEREEEEGSTALRDPGSSPVTQPERGRVNRRQRTSSSAWIDLMGAMVDPVLHTTVWRLQS